MSSEDPNATLQDIRMLCVISNFGHLSKTVIPGMLSQLESALGVAVLEDKQVRPYRHLI